MKKFWPILLLFACTLLSFFAALTVYAKTTAFSTYYASPSGTYSKLRLISNSDTAQPSCSASTTGTLFIDNATGALNVCQYNSNTQTPNMISYPGACFNRFYTTTPPVPACPSGFSQINSTGNDLDSSFPGSSSITVNSITCCYIGPSNTSSSDSNPPYAKAGCFMTFCSDSGGSSCPPTSCPAGTYQPVCLEATNTAAGTNVEKRTCCYGDSSLSVQNPNSFCGNGTDGLNCTTDNECYSSAGNSDCMHCDSGVCRSYCGPGMTCYNNMCLGSEDGNYPCKTDADCSDGGNPGFTTCRTCVLTPGLTTGTCQTSCPGYNTCNYAKNTCENYCNPRTNAGCQSGYTCVAVGALGRGYSAGSICVATCDPSKNGADCNDNNACTTDTCSSNNKYRVPMCSHNQIANCCDPANNNSNGMDDIDCTVWAHHTCPINNTCVNNQCQYTPSNGCCMLSGSDCDDGDPCTWDECSAGFCYHIPTHGSGCH